MNPINNDQSIRDWSKLLEYCPNEDIDNAKVYVYTFKDKINRICYAIDEIKNQRRLEDSRNFPVFRLKSLIFLESIAYNLHSLADVLAHIISIFILTPVYHEIGKPERIIEPRKISINTIKDRIQEFKDNPDTPWKRDYYANLFDSIENLKNGDQFKYIESFVNTIKHRNLIPESLQTEEFMEPEKWIFDKFEKDGHNFEKMNQDSLFEYAETILDLCTKIGQTINSYCCANFISNGGSKPNSLKLIEE